MDRRAFEKHLLIHGADLNQWPEELRRTAAEALASSSELRVLADDYRHFESVLKMTTYEQPASDLTERIVGASLHERQRAGFSLGDFLAELRAEFSLKSPALTAVSTLLLVTFLLAGFLVGFSHPLNSFVDEQRDVHLREFLYDEGEVL